MSLRTYLMIKQADLISFDQIPPDKKPTDPTILFGTGTLQKYDDLHTPLGKHYTDIGGKMVEPGKYTYIGGNNFSENIPVVPDYQKKFDDANKYLADAQAKKDNDIAARMKKNRMSYLKAMLAGAGLFGGGSLLMNMGAPVNRPGLYHGGITAVGALGGLLTAAMYNRWLKNHEGRTPFQSMWHSTVEKPVEYFNDLGNAPAKGEDWARMNKTDAEVHLNNPGTINNAPATNSDYQEWNKKGNPPVII